MKKADYTLRAHGCTPEAQAEFLAKHAHLEGIVPMTTLSGCSKYYTYNGAGFNVICVDDKAIQINKINPDEIKRIISCSKLRFGGF